MIYNTSQPTYSTAHCRSVAYATDHILVVFLGVSFINLHTIYVVNATALTIFQLADLGSQH